ncbi:MAG: hypothetical protein WA751_06875 [Candidatus Dormiibacterota bacterium]
MSRTREAAMTLSEMFPKLGTYISEVDVPESAALEWDEDDENHADLRGIAPETALGWVSSTVAIGRRSE